jgi:hypothetical protein
METDRHRQHSVQQLSSDCNYRQIGDVGAIHFIASIDPEPGYPALQCPSRDPRAHSVLDSDDDDVEGGEDGSFNRSDCGTH